MSNKTGRYFAAKNDTGEIVHLFIRPATKAELTNAQFEYSRTFNSALASGLPTRKKQLKVIKAAKQWTPEDDAEMETAREKAIELEAQLAKANLDKDFDAEAKITLKADYDAAMEEFNELRQEIEVLLAHTSDALADNAYRNFLVATTIVYAEKDADGNPVNEDKIARGKRGEKIGTLPLWPSLEALLGENDRKLTTRAIYEYTMLQAGLESTWDEDQVEDDEGEAGDDTDNTDAGDDTTADTTTTDEVAVVTDEPATLATIPTIE